MHAIDAALRLLSAGNSGSLSGAIDKQENLLRPGSAEVWSLSGACKEGVNASSIVMALGLSGAEL